jgi:hypothetical protein
MLQNPAGKAAADEVTEGGVSDGLAEGKAEFEIRSYAIQKLEEAGETNEITSDLRDAFENLAQTANSLVGVPSEDLISNNLVSRGATLEITNAVPAGRNVSVEAAAIALGDAESAW